MNRNTLIILGIVLILVIVLFIYYTGYFKPVEGFTSNVGNKYIALPILTKKDDLYNSPIKVDENNIPLSIYDNSIGNVEFSESKYATDDYNRDLKYNYYTTLINRLMSIKTTNVDDDDNTIINYDKNDIIDNIFIINNNELTNKFKIDNSVKYRKEYDTNNNTINTVELSDFEFPQVSENLLMNFVVLKFKSDITDEQLNTYFKYIDEYVATNIKHNVITTTTNEDGEQVTEETSFISSPSNLPFNIELNETNMGADLVSKLVELPTELYSLYQYYLAFIKIRKSDLEDYPKTNGQIETRYNPLNYVNNNYKYIINKLNNEFRKSPRFSIISKDIEEITIATKNMLDKIHTSFNNKEKSDGHRYHQYMIKGLTNCDYNIVYNDNSDTNRFEIVKLNIGDTSALNLDNVKSSFPKCGEANTLFTLADNEPTTANEMVENSGGEFINIPIIFKVKSETNPSFIYNLATSLHSNRNITTGQTNLFIVLNSDNENNITAITTNQYFVKLNEITELNTLFNTLPEQVELTDYTTFNTIEDDTFNPAVYPEFTGEENNSNTNPSQQQPTNVATETTQPTNVATETTQPTNVATETTQPTNVATETTQQQQTQVTQNRQVSEGTLLDVNGNPLPFGLPPGSDPGTESHHQGNIISSPGFNTNSNNIYSDRIVGNIDTITASELHAQMHGLDPYFNNYSVPANGVNSRGNIYVKDYQGTLNIFYPNIISN